MLRFFQRFNELYLDFKTDKNGAKIPNEKTVKRDCDGKPIKAKKYKSHDYVLEVKDTGKGYNPDFKGPNSADYTKRRQTKYIF